MIIWPCIFKLEGDSELLYLPSEYHLITELDALIWDSSDLLIDSNGLCYAVKEEKEGYAFVPKGEQLSLESVTQLIQEHEFSKAQMCLIKIQFPSIQQAIKALATES